MENDTQPVTEVNGKAVTATQSHTMYKPYRKLEEPDDDHLQEQAMPLMIYQNVSGDVNGAVVDRNGRVQARVWLN